MILADFNKYKNVKNISVVCACPSNEETFKLAWKSNKLDDFFDSQLIGTNCLLSAWKKYAPIAKFIENQFAYLESLGVNVVRNASSCDFRKSLNRDEVIILIAHHVVPEYHIGQILNTELTIKKIKYNNFIKRHRFHDSYAQSIVDEIDECIKTSEQKNLVCEFMNYIMMVLSKYIENKSIQISSRVAFDTRARSILDRVFYPEIRTANKLEFFDGSFSANELSSGIKPEEGTIVDLLVCKSLFFAQNMKKNIGSNILFICGREPVALHARTAICSMTVKLVKEHRVSYEEAARRLRHQVSKIS